MEWKYDVVFTFFAAFHVDTPSDLTALHAAFSGASLQIKPDSSSSSFSFELEDISRESNKELAAVLIVEKSGRPLLLPSKGEGSDAEKAVHPGGLPLVPGDELIVCFTQSQEEGTSSKNISSISSVAATSELLDVKWGSPECKGAASFSSSIDALAILQAPKLSPPPTLPSPSSFRPFVLRLRRPVCAPLDRRQDLAPCMAAALTEWNRRCAALFLNKQPRCGRRIALEVSAQ
jgi:hypothetical protein